MTMSMIMIEVDCRDGHRTKPVVKERGQVELTCSGVSQCQC